MDDCRIIDVANQLRRMDDVRALFRAYAEEIGIDLGFQGFEDELIDLPGCYSAPSGCILLAELDNAPAACIALRRLGDAACELKRMYVKPEHRGRGLASALVSEALQFANNQRYMRVLLDTLGSMKAARKLYESFGFVETDPYYINPLPDVVFYELDLYARARDVVAANAHEVGDGRWAVAFYNDDTSTFEFVHMVLNQCMKLSPEVAAAVMQMTHLHGSAIARRFHDRSQAQALYEKTEGFLVRQGQPLRIAVIDLEKTNREGPQRAAK
ncbi:MAG: ATP-dependent Clp protease adaptor ClpS [Planctomycetes bacterium]|nr:ATP-dependent Clp protease adaptor ClpS [Planctomycetota bacterium]